MGMALETTLSGYGIEDHSIGSQHGHMIEGHPLSLSHGHGIGDRHMHGHGVRDWTVGLCPEPFPFHPLSHQASKLTSMGLSSSPILLLAAVGSIESHMTSTNILVMPKKNYLGSPVQS